MVPLSQGNDDRGRERLLVTHLFGVGDDSLFGIPPRSSSRHSGRTSSALYATGLTGMKMIAILNEICCKRHRHHVAHF